MRQRLSSGEWVVMNALWRAGKQATVDDVRVQLEDDERDYRTIQTILSRCEEKGWVKSERTKSRRVYYTPAVTRRKGIQERAADIVAELTQGDEAAVEYVRSSLARELGITIEERENGGKGGKSVAKRQQSGR